VLAAVNPPNLARTIVAETFEAPSTEVVNQLRAMTATGFPAGGGGALRPDAARDDRQDDERGGGRALRGKIGRGGRESGAAS
jgi:hypothetical protein